MVPTNTVSLVLFVVLLAPGFLAGVARSRATPSAAQTAFRETVTVIFLSLVAWCFVGLLAAAVRGIAPEGWTPNVGALARNSTQEWQSRNVFLTWWAIGLVVSACVAGYFLGRLTSSDSAKSIGRWLTPGPTSHHSAWYLTLAPDAEYFDSDASTNTLTPGGPTVITLVLDDGSVIIGDVLSFSPNTPENVDRELVLTAPIFIKAGANPELDDELTDGVLVVSNRHIKYFTVQKFTEPRPAPSS